MEGRFGHLRGQVGEHEVTREGAGGEWKDVSGT